MKRPAFQFYPADWRKDVELRSCTVAARGFWIDLLCIAHECDPYGHLVVNGHPMTTAQIAGQVGIPTSQCARLLDELLANGVARKTPNGTIYNKRMVDDERLRNIRAEAGAMGGNPALLGGKDKQRDKQKVNHSGKQNPTPSSSSSSSPTTSTPKTSAQGACIRPDEIPEQVWNDFLKIRKAKRAPLTDTALDGIRSEAEKAGYSLTQALETCCRRGWQGFEAAWVTNETTREFGKTSQAIALLEQMKG